MQRISLVIGLLAGCAPAHARFLSVDPVPANPHAGAHFNRFHYAANNPFRYTDPDGREIRATWTGQQQQIESTINAQATQVFRFGDDNRLRAVGPAAPGHVGSARYTDGLLAGIAAQRVIEIAVVRLYIDARGHYYDVDAFGGGLTGETGSGDLRILVSGNPFRTTDADGRAIIDSPADILRHELIGHAIPVALGVANGNAIDNDNATRRELGRPLLPRDPSHREDQR
jgi:YD repeat-containing protein